MASVTNQPTAAWETSARTLTLTVSLHRTTHVLPWSSFMAAQGDDNALRIRFLEQIVEVQGSGLSALLRDVAMHSVSHIVEPHRTEKFYTVQGPRISALTVTPTNQR